MRSSRNKLYPFDDSNTYQSYDAGLRKSAGRRRPRRASRFLRWPVWLALILLLGLFLGLLLFTAGSGGWSGLSGLLAFFSKTAATTTASTAAPTTATPTTAEPTSTASVTPEPTPTPETAPDVRVVLTGVGDIILHKAVIDGGLTNPGEKEAVYDYSPIFQYVKPILGAADLAMANYEGTLAGPPYSGYPFFCAPDAIADALADTGVKGVWTANNHTIDKGLAGVIRTAQVFQAKGFQVVGTRPDESRPADAVISVRGIQIGLMAYTFETIGTETQKALNGIPMPAAADPLIDSFNPYRSASMARDLQAMLDRAAILRGQGAEIICLSLHWGNEYQTRSNSYQRKMAQQLADAGIELIIGHHPHVIQEITVLTSAKTGRPTLVYYSVGNFLANMDYGTHNSAGKAQDAVIARITLLRRGGVVRIEKAEYIPTHVVRVPKGKGLQHLIVPVLPALADPAAFQATQAEMEAARDRIAAILGDSQGNSDLAVEQAAR